LFKLTLILRRKSDEIMFFSPAPWFRIIFSLLLVVLVIGILSVSGDGSEKGNLLFPVIIGAVCFLAAFYEESWLFDKEKRIIISKYGLLFLNRRKVYSFAEIQDFELMSFLRGVNADKSADKKINLTPAFSKENTDEIAGEGRRIIHKRWHQELILNLKSGDRKTLEAIDSRSTESLLNKAGILADFCGIPLMKKD